MSCLTASHHLRKQSLKRLLSGNEINKSLSPIPPFTTSMQLRPRSYLTAPSQPRIQTLKQPHSFRTSTSSYLPSHQSHPHSHYLLDSYPITSEIKPSNTHSLKKYQQPPVLPISHPTNPNPNPNPSDISPSHKHPVHPAPFPTNASASPDHVGNKCRKRDRDRRRLGSGDDGHGAVVSAKIPFNLGYGWSFICWGLEWSGVSCGALVTRNVDGVLAVWCSECSGVVNGM